MSSARQQPRQTPPWLAAARDLHALTDQREATRSLLHDISSLEACDGTLTRSARPARGEATDTDLLFGVASLRRVARQNDPA